VRCRSTRRRISEFVDGDLEQGRTARLERHIGSCLECRALLKDFRAIREAAGRLETPAVPDDAWLKVRAGLREKRSPNPGAFPRLPRLAPVAAAFLIIFGAGIVFVLMRGPAGDRKAVRKDEQYTLSRLDEAERIYEQADRTLSEAVAGRRGKIDPRIAEMFERNIEAVDGALKTCRQTARVCPGDIRVRGFLLDAYREKIVLLNDFLDREKEA
jgi:anti-sigma factor RsiW